MPYGIKDETPADTKFMESCVMKVMKTGKDKGTSVAICKASLEKSKKNPAKAEIVISLILENLGK